ncbi:MAG: NHL repeat-containing protein, partial [Thermomicrobiales bacterium]
GGPYTIDDRPGPGAGDGQFMQPVGIATGPDGSIYVMDSGNARVERFSPDGAFIGAWGPRNGVDLLRTDTGFGPTGIATGPDGNVYLADTWNHRIFVVDPSGAVILQIGGPTADTSDDPANVKKFPGQFFGPRAIAAGKDAIYVADTGNERIQVFSPDGTFENAFGGYGHDDGQLVEPVGLAIGPDGDIYVADSGNQRISIFSPDGTFLRSFLVESWPVPDPSGLRPFFQPYLTFDQAGNLIVSSSASGSIEIYDPKTGEPVDSIRAAAGEPLKEPIGVAIAGNGDLLVTDSGASTVVRVPARQLPGAGPAG